MIGFLYSKFDRVVKVTNLSFVVEIRVGSNPTACKHHGILLVILDSQQKSAMQVQYVIG